MKNEVLKTILFKKEITIKDRILFKTIFEVLSTLFTNEDGVSILKSGYKINDYQQVWFLTISSNSEKEEVIKTGYANFCQKIEMLFINLIVLVQVKKENNWVKNILKIK